MAAKGRQNTLLTPNIVPLSFFQQDALHIAPSLLGKYLVRRLPDGNILKSAITEVEVYRGEEDLACHASKGRTQRTEVMYLEGGHIYVYFIYGMYYMLNIVTGKKDEPQAILIRGTLDVIGPGKLTRYFKIDKTFNRKLLIPENQLWLEDNGCSFSYETTYRIGIDYAKEWKYKPWRYVAKTNK